MDIKITTRFVKVNLAKQFSQRTNFGFGFDKYSQMSLGTNGMNIHISCAKYEITLIFQSKFPVFSQDLWSFSKIENLRQNFWDVLVNPEHQGVMGGRLKFLINESKSLLERFRFRYCHIG